MVGFWREFLIQFSNPIPVLLHLVYVRSLFAQHGIGEGRRRTKGQNFPRFLSGVVVVFLSRLYVLMHIYFRSTMFISIYFNLIVKIEHFSSNSKLYRLGITLFFIDLKKNRFTSSTIQK